MLERKTSGIEVGKAKCLIGQLFLCFFFFFARENEPKAKYRTENEEGVRVPRDAEKLGMREKDNWATC